MSEAAHDQGHGYTPPVKNGAVRFVPWACKPWQSMTERDREDIQRHLTTFDSAEKLLGYKRYLRDWCGVPAGWLDLPAL